MKEPDGLTKRTAQAYGQKTDQRRAAKGVSALEELIFLVSELVIVSYPFALVG